MDPLTQGLLGGVAAQVVCGRALPRTAWLIGFVAGTTADLDVFIRPSSDPLGGMTYHRHFTHSLAFIPVGALLSALPFLPWRRFAGRRLAVLAAALLGYATHGLLDACTSFGTLLWWPFSEARIALDIIGIVDPIFTLILAAGLTWAVLKRRRDLAGVTLGLALLYLGAGVWQHHRAATVQRTLAEQRGRVMTRGRVLPTAFNLVVWRSIYEADGILHADLIRVPPLGEPSVRPGSSTPRVTLVELEAAARATGEPGVTAQLHRAWERFDWLADGYTAYDARDARVVGDMRYSVRPDVFASPWGLRIPGPGEPGEARLVRLQPRRGRDLHQLWVALLGRDPRFRPLAALPGAGAGLSLPHDCHSP